MALFLALALSAAPAHAGDAVEVRALDAGVDHLHIELPAGEVTVERVAGLRHVEVRTRRLAWDDTDCAIEVSAHRRRAHITVEKHRTSRDRCEASIELRLPGAADVVVELGEGEVALRGLTGESRVRIASGALTIDGVRGPLAVRMDRGVIAGTHSSQDVELRLDEGEILLQGVPRVASDAAPAGDAG